MGMNPRFCLWTCEWYINSTYQRTFNQIRNYYIQHCGILLFNVDVLWTIETIVLIIADTFKTTPHRLFDIQFLVLDFIASFAHI